MAVILVSLLLVVVAATLLFIQHPKFGKAPAGERLKRIQQSPHYKNGTFQNVHFTPYLTEGYSAFSVFYNFLFKKHPRTEPADSIPSIKTNLHTLPADEDILVWFGHSSYYIQVSGKRFLVDPVFSGNASPLPGSTPSFKGTDIYTVDDIPEIDFLLITHDHYDHLDYKTILSLQKKVKTVICGLGVGEHFEYWGYDAGIIHEKDWDEEINLADSLNLYTATARHFSGRLFSRNNTLWLSFIIETPHRKLYLGGDSGYATHFAEIGEKFGPFDLAILDNGQYNVAWQAIHMLPEEGLKAAQDLKAKRLFPVHSSKFKLAHHAWDEPLKKITELNAQHNIPLVTPIIGEIVRLDDEHQSFTHWWATIK
ncbi:MAG: MBL fold metallo-hydrolase [Cyclobacteriaceae bacterium]|nr:MBL fold metallo-hydrolase [Cyclobacteriaceae bacterium]